MRGWRLAGLVSVGIAAAFLFGLAGAWYLGGDSHQRREGSQGLAGGLERPPGGAFALSDQEGRPVASADLAGRYLLVYFGYSQCSDACPLAMAAMSGAVARLPAEQVARLAPLLVTLDPLVDDGEQLSRYLENFHPAFRALRGEAEEVAAAAAAFRVAYDPEAREDALGRRVIDHGASIYLMGPDGAFLRQFDYRVDPDRLAEVLSGYLAAAAAG